MKKIFLLILLLLFSCDDDRHLNSMLTKLVTHAKKKYNLDCAGSGYAAPIIIKKFLLSFEYEQKITYDEARRLIVCLTEDLINISNTDPIIIQNLEKPPFSEKNLYYLISFPGNGSDFSGISLSCGEIIFHANHPPQKYFDVRIEPYNEAYYRVFGTEPPIRN